MKRRTFLSAATCSALLLPAQSGPLRKYVNSLTRPTRPDCSIEVLTGAPIGTIAPEIYGFLAEHLGGVVYDWQIALNASRYDNYPRNGPKVFAGEYAAQSVGIASPDNRNNWECAMPEAAFMTGLERNADIVAMSSYAPLFGHVDAWQWTPNLIWFDSLRSYGAVPAEIATVGCRQGSAGVSCLRWDDRTTGVTDLNDRLGKRVAPRRDFEVVDPIPKLNLFRPSSASL